MMSPTHRANTGGTRGRLFLATVAVMALLALVAGTMLVAGAIGPEGTREAPSTGDEIRVTASDHLRMPANNSPQLVADPTDERFVVAANRLDALDFGCALNVSADGGQSWVPSNPVPTLPEGADKCYGPEVAFDRSGRLYFLFVGLQADGNQPMGAFLVTSADRGRTFSPPRQVLGPLNFGVRLAIDLSAGARGRMHLVWLAAGADPGLGSFAAVPNPIMAAYSDDGGTTFSEAVQVSDPARARVVAPTLALGPGHAVHVGYYDLGDDARDYLGLEGPVWEGTWSVIVATSRDGGENFGRGSVVVDDIVPPERPILIFTMAPPALAAGGGRVCAAWTDARHGDSDVLARCSQASAQRWSELRRVNDDAIGNGVTQYMPRIAIAPGGRIDAVYLDRRHRSTNALNDVSYSSSEDGGESFSPAMRLTEESWSPRIGPRYAGGAAAGKVEIGSRLGLLSLRSSALVAWADTRFPALSARQFVNQDVVAREVRIPEPNRPSWGRWLGAVLLGSFGALALAVLYQRQRRAKAKATPAAAASSPMPDAAPPVDDAESPGAPEPESDSEVVVAAGPRPIGRRVMSLLGPLALVAVVVVVGSKLAAPPPVVAPVPTAFLPQVVDVTMREYSFDHSKPARGGRVVFRVTNQGEVAHQFGLYLIDDDFPPIDEQVRGVDRRNIDAPVELPPARPGEAQDVAVDLRGGQRYALICLLRTTAADDSHAVLGMTSEFRTE